ncbi:ribosome silencing factor [Brooklawnia cerclae]
MNTGPTNAGSDVSATESALSITRLAAQAASDKKGLDIVAFDVSEALAITDVFLIVSASNERQVGAIVDAVEERLIQQANLRPTRREGDRENRWVLLDYVDVVVHVQHSEERTLYSLERLWKDCPRIPLDLDEASAAEGEDEE